MDLINLILFSDRTPKLIRKSLDFKAQKAAITASNIANAETPGYKAVHVSFEDVLQQAAAGKNLPMKTTNQKHISGKGQEIGRLEPKIEVDRSAGRMDGNNVDMEKEVTSLSETEIAYEAAISAMLKRGAIVKSAITDSR